MTEIKPVMRKEVEWFYRRVKEELPWLRERMKAEGLDEKNIEKEVELVLTDVSVKYAMDHFWFFVTEILGWKGLDDTFHGDLSDFMEKPHPLKLVLAPRGHLKSTLCTVAYALWRAFKNPNIRILISNYREANAGSFLFQIRNELLSERLKTFFPKAIPNLRNVKWNESQITLNRTSNPKEATFEIAGVGNEITGRHYDLILFDDIVGPENIGTLEQLQKLQAWWNQMQAILEPGGEQVLVGTRWHYADLYGFILENMASEFLVWQSDVYRDDGVTPVWEAKFTREILKSIEDRMSKDPRQGRALWLAQYRNTIVDEQTAVFRRAKMKYFAEKDIPAALGVSITLDPAISEKQSADRAAITVRGVSEQNDWYVLEVWAERGKTPDELVEKLFEIYEKWNAKFPVGAVGVEAISYQKSLVYSINDAMRKKNVFLPLVELGNYRTSKELRIRGLVPRYEQGALLFRKPADSGDQTAILLDEMAKFPKSAHDDCLDSLAMHLELEVIPGILTVEEKDPDAPKEGYDRYGYPVDPRPMGTNVSFL